MIYVFYFFAAVLVWLSFKSFLAGLRYLRYFRSETTKSPSSYTPFASVIAPCRGVDDGFAENISAVLEQDYANFQVIFVVDDMDDPSVPIIRSLIGAAGSGPHLGARNSRLKLVVAPRATQSSQKVENLREGVRHADPASEIFVFVDSDSRPGRNWLSSLVAALQNKSVGAATGYRWFISERRSFASELLSVWNASIASALSPTGASFCWGGSSAIRRETFERLAIRERWGRVVSDDFVLADAVKKAELEIVFVPQALTASFQTSSLRDLFEFTNRQMKLTRVYASPLWLMTLVGCGLFVAVMSAALAIVVSSRTNGLAVWLSITTILLVSLFSIGKAWLRLNAIKLALPQYEEQLRKQFWPQNTLWLISSALFLINSLAALLSRRITWRGTTYELKSGTETVIIAPDHGKHL